MSDTPETDAAAIKNIYGVPSEVDVDFARKMERERDEAREELRIATGVISTYAPFNNRHPEEVLQMIKLEAAK